MARVAKEILGIRMDTTSVPKVYSRFYAIMRKYGIREGTVTPGKPGRQTANYEWTMCLTLLESQVVQAFVLSHLLGRILGARVAVPKDLEAY